MSVYADRPWLGHYAPWVLPDLPLPALVPEIAEARAATEPDRACLTYFGSTITNAEVQQFTAQLAASLAHLGVGPGDNVGVQLQNMPQYVFATLAAWRLGATIVPVNPMYRERELAHVLSDASTRVLITLDSLYEIAADVRDKVGIAHVVTTSPHDFLDGSDHPKLLEALPRLACPGSVDLVELMRSSPAWQEKFAPESGRPAFLTYTSGTGGMPKGALNTHGNVAFSAEVFRVWRRLGPHDGVLALAPLFLGHALPRCARLQHGVPDRR